MVGILDYLSRPTPRTSGRDNLAHLAGGRCQGKDCKLFHSGSVHPRRHRAPPPPAQLPSLAILLAIY